MSRGVLVVGTDTDVGKTIVCAGLTLSLRKTGLAAGYLKPLASDCHPTPEGPLSPDVALVHRLAGLPELPTELNPICLSAPLAPLAAARREGIELSLGQALDACRTFMERHSFSVIEGVGGLLVPIAPGATLLELAQGLGLPVLVVGRAGLGTINHTLLTIEALRQGGPKVLGFVFSASEPEAGSDPSTKDNPALVTEFSGAPHLGTLPYLGPEDQITPPALYNAVQDNLDLRPLYTLAGGS